ncbi:hypothetical protein GCM10023149_42750 [Mucilaginibacter gynuensis]|uniref:Uncharacterized protein n=1 Tax=Mucilaginibacter gynuensis TaxID=1302236 RepID=A0ABP8H6C7_9SPHI
MQEYINSGILETYVLGCASEEEAREVLYMKEQHPEIRSALEQLEIDMERIAEAGALLPPPGTWSKIEKQIEEISLRQPTEPAIYRERYNDNTQAPPTPPDYINVESESSHMRIHKVWRWVFAAVFVLGKIFLGFAIYYYLENRQMQEQLLELKTEMKQLKK